MREWPIGISTGCFYREPLLNGLERLRAAGFSILEISSAREHLDYRNLPMLRKLRKAMHLQALEVYSFHAPWGEEIDISSPNDKIRKDSVEELTLAIGAASFLGARYFVLHAGPEREDLPLAETPSRMVHTAAALNELAGTCERSGLELVLENKLSHLFAGRLCDLLWLFGSIHSSRVGLCLDSGHAFLARDLSGFIRKMSGHLRLVHASDNLGRFDDHLAPGKGAIPWSGLLSQLGAGAFSGTLILELAPLSSLEVTLEEAGKARQQLRLAMRSATGN